MASSMKVRIPKRVNLLGRIFLVKIVSTQVIYDKMGTPVWGLMDWMEKTIYICSELNEHEQILTLFHECTHAVHYIYGLNQVISPELQEILCESTANMIEDLLPQIKKAP
jgi:Zn-dependent peptidase ImmA (M78 family)